MAKNFHWRLFFPFLARPEPKIDPKGSFLASPLINLSAKSFFRPGHSTAME
jgi:hypothetical protein